MSVPLPEPAEQIRFLQQIRRLLSDGSFVASYKFALLHAIADLAVTRGEDSGAELRLATRAITEQMIVLYWRQARPFPIPGGSPVVLRQSTGGKAAIVSELERVQSGHSGSLSALQRERAAWDHLVREVDRTVRRMPLWKLQTVGEERLDFLYENVGHGSEITLRSGVMYCLRAFHDLIVDLVRGAWLRYVRRYNAALLGGTSDLDSFLFGSERSSLAVFQPILMEAQAGCCFYCERPLRSGGEVDHFVAWSRYPVDLGHNFVLADPACNNRKSDHMAAEPHLERWLLRNVRYGAGLAAAFSNAGIVHDSFASARVTEWAYAQAERLGALAWERGTSFVPLTGAWRDLLVGNTFPHRGLS
jgi:hypothetical protein